MSDIEIEINGQKLAAKQNQTVMEVADAAGIYIPRFCYHKHLSIAANCRMCLVEVEKSPKTLPACATPVMPGMKVYTQSPKTIEAQRAVMEFLLINHPLDCPVCDQGGECELQDLSMGYGGSHSHYDECKRAVPDLEIGPLIATEMTRCIQCTRCVRFGDEIAGMRELGVTNRGEHAEISTYVQQAVVSEVSGNIIDLCPVGALTSKPYRFTARAWELRQAPSIAPHDCIGSNLNVHTRQGEVKRVVARENFAINETWISDRDRFSYEGLYHAARLSEPMARIQGEWQTVTWEKALELISTGLQKTISEYGADQFGALASPNATIEELYLLQKLVRGLGSDHVDHRLREMDTSDQGAKPSVLASLSVFDQADAIVLIGSNIQKEQPLAALRIRKAIKNNAAAVVAMNAVDYQFNFGVTAKHIVAPHRLPTALAEWVDALEKGTNHPFIQPLKDKKNIHIILGAASAHHPHASKLRQLAQRLATLIQGTVTILTEGANGTGAWIAGAVPRQNGLNAYEMLRSPRQAYLLLNVEPELDSANAKQAVEALKQAKFVAAMAMYRNSALEAHADVILPICAFAETSGTYVNVTGTWQSFQGVAKPVGAARPAWKVLRVLGNFLHLAGFEYESSEDVREAVRAEGDTFVAAKGISPRDSNTTLSRIGEIPIYASDSLVRHSQPLQATQALMELHAEAASMHPETAKKLNLTSQATVTVKQAGTSLTLPLIVDDRVALDAVRIAGGVNATLGLGDLMGEIEIG